MNSMIQKVSDKESSKYKKWVKGRLSQLSEIFASASIGDFSKDLKIPQKEDEFTELYVGIQVMIDVIREKITELKKEKFQIQIERDLLQTLINNLPVGVIIIEAPSGKPVLINKKAAELFGSRTTKTGEKVFVELFRFYKEDGKVYPTEERPVQITLKEGRRVSKTDLVIKRRDGREIFIKMQSVPVFDKRGKMVSVVAVFDDITKQKELDRLKTQFVSVASHQLRTPLGTMRWNLEMLVNGDYGPLGKEIETVIKDIYESNSRLIELVNDLLNVSRIEEVRDFDEPTTVNLESLIQEAVTSILPIIEKKGLKVTVKKKGKFPGISIDKTKIENVIINLLSNAVKYNFDGGRVDILITTDNKHMYLSVKDTGVGISEKDKDKVFAKFYRTEEAVKLNSEGTGLGLFLVKSYVESWGGRVTFNSKVGEGSEFIVKIPLVPKLHLPKKNKIK